VDQPSTGLIQHFAVFHVARDDFGSSLPQSKPQQISNTKDGLFDLIHFLFLLPVAVGVCGNVFEKEKPYFLG
jgi:hypothetical protein